jgi:flagellar biosynthesis protein FlhF
MLSFLGETPTLALKKAQQECGEDAIVMSTKKISGGLDEPSVYEVIVAVEDEVMNKKTQTRTSPTLDLGAIAGSDYFPKSAENVDEFKSEILKMKDVLSQVQKTLWEPKSQLFDLTIPLEFIDIYSLFEKNEFDKEMTYSILKKTIEQLPVPLKSDPNKVINFFHLVLRRLIPIKMEVPLQSQQRKIMMFVGPTGVGKTTTIAKLAARYAYKLGDNYKVGIITLDSFRVGAVEQLQAYTNIMRLPLEVVKKPEDLSESIARLKDCNYILIDTAGSSQYDQDKIDLILEYQLKVDVNIEKTLVLPANVKQSDLAEIYEHYSKLDIDYLTYTKLDETKSFGNLISFVHKVKKSITYFSIGQNVPDDLIEADAKFLINCFMNLSCIRS